VKKKKSLIKRVSVPAHVGVISSGAEVICNYGRLQKLRGELTLRTLEFSGIFLADERVG